MLQRNIVLIVICALYSCVEPESIDLELEKDEILKLHMEQRKYHFEKDSTSFANQLSDNFISVNRGIITKPSRTETVGRYNRYFSSVEFRKWDDLSEPVVRFSPDGKMAYTIVNKIVETEEIQENGDTVLGSTHFAWTAIYRKYADEWKIDCVTSTQQPSK